MDAVVGAADADIAAGFLHDDDEDGADVDARRGRDGFDGAVDQLDFGVARVKFHEARILRPQRRVGCPLGWVGVCGCGAGVGYEVAAAVAAALGADDLAVAALGWGWSATVAAIVVVVAATREVDGLTNLEGGWVDARVGGLEGVDGDAEFLGDGPEGVAGLDGVAHIASGG